MQYNKFEFNEAQYGPYPAKVSADRVTDENAPIEVLVPDHPVFNTPNKIGPSRGPAGCRSAACISSASAIRATSTWCDRRIRSRYNTGAKTGALVEARVGKGRWVYVGLGLWRQLPAGTEGAYRLMANLLSLGQNVVEAMRF